MKQAIDRADHALELRLKGRRGKLGSCGSLQRVGVLWIGLVWFDLVWLFLP